jgi:hypothetical protein
MLRSLIVRANSGEVAPTDGHVEAPSTVTKLAGILAAAVTLVACSLQPDPPPEFPLSAYGGMGDVMAKCMQYASESVCYQQTWGSDEP